MPAPDPKLDQLLRTAIEQTFNPCHGSELNCSPARDRLSVSATT
jgi:hypothetical protein